eukprot:115751-Chlamydomonas_euryale.AAC.1
MERQEQEQGKRELCQVGTRNWRECLECPRQLNCEASWRGKEAVAVCKAPRWLQSSRALAGGGRVQDGMAPCI